ncbi:MAG: hypothetical protein EBZ59_11965, partial [Planctomycetia bacterium]|nr:hypothetical protein [Planctomycetia bacterium]
GTADSWFTFTTGGDGRPGDSLVVSDGAPEPTTTIRVEAGGTLTPAGGSATVSQNRREDASITLGGAGAAVGVLEFDLAPLLRSVDRLDALVDAVDLRLDYAATVAGFPATFDLSTRAVIDGVLYVAARPEGETGFTLYRTDGTVVGTRKVALADGTTFASPAHLQAVGGRLFLTASVTSGRDLWMLTPSAAGFAGVQIDSQLATLDDVAAVAATSPQGAVTTAYVAYTRTAGGQTAPVKTAAVNLSTNTFTAAQVTYRQAGVFLVARPRTAVNEPARLAVVMGASGPLVGVDAYGFNGDNTPNTSRHDLYVYDFATSVRTRPSLADVAVATPIRVIGSDASKGIYATVDRTAWHAGSSTFASLGTATSTIDSLFEASGSLFLPQATQLQVTTVGRTSPVAVEIPGMQPVSLENVRELVTVGSGASARIVFTATADLNGAKDRELFIVDPAAIKPTGTDPVSVARIDVNVQPAVGTRATAASNPSGLFASGGRLYFTADDGLGYGPELLWLDPSATRPTAQPVRDRSPVPR